VATAAREQQPFSPAASSAAHSEGFGTVSLLRQMFKVQSGARKRRRGPGQQRHEGVREVGIATGSGPTSRWGSGWLQ
jgi:hypothetical protein